MDYIMETVGLRKAYKGNIVVDNVNIHIPKGAIYGFVGPILTNIIIYLPRTETISSSAYKKKGSRKKR